MKCESRILVITCLMLLMETSCATIGPLSENGHSLITRVETENTQNQYDKALKRWQSAAISNYEITVEVFSSMLAPPCSMKATLVVQNNKLLSRRDLETPIPVQKPDGDVIFNPECHDYERYIISNQLEQIGQLLLGQLPYHWNVQYDEEYGYISHLDYYIGETSKRIEYSDFKKK